VWTLVPGVAHHPDPAGASCERRPQHGADLVTVVIGHHDVGVVELEPRRVRGHLVGVAARVAGSGRVRLHERGAPSQPPGERQQVG